MGILNWLFGGATGVKWSRSANGNPVIFRLNRCITVFRTDSGWKYCIATIDEDDNPYFSEVYETEVAAKFEALARLEGRESRYRPMYEVSEVDGR